MTSLPLAPLPRDAERRAERHVMFDIESLGCDAGDVFFAIAAVPFDPYEGTLGQPFFALVDPADAVRHGLRSDPGTIQWWEKQSSEARAYLDAASTEGAPLDHALKRLSAYLHEVVGPRDQIRVWGKGADFDKPFLDAGYRVCHLPQPWGPRAARCYRTLEAFMPVAPPRMTLTGIAHHALDDTIHQAMQAIPALREIYRMEPLVAPILPPPSSRWVEDPLAREVVVEAPERRRRRQPR